MPPKKVPFKKTGRTGREAIEKPKAKGGTAKSNFVKREIGKGNLKKEGKKIVDAKAKTPTPKPKAKDKKETKLKLPPTFKAFYNDELKYDIDVSKYGESTLSAMLDYTLGGEDGEKELKKAVRIANARYKIFKKTPLAMNSKTYQQLAERFKEFV